jgi:hypothetical protein
MADDAIRIDVDLADLKAEKGLKKIERQSKRTFKSFERDSKRGGKAARRFGASLGRVRGKLLALLGGFSAVALVRKGVQNFLVQEKAVTRLSAALAAQGITAQIVLKDMEEYAAELQKVTIHSDEALIAGMALAVGMKATQEQAQDLALTAADLSAQFGISFEQAMRQAAKTLGGFAGELGELLPELKDQTPAQLRDSAIVRIVRERFGGTAKRLADSEGGRLIQQQNRFGDQLEKLGLVVLPHLTEALETLTDHIDEFLNEGIVGLSKEAQRRTEKAERELAAAQKAEAARRIDIRKVNDFLRGAGMRLLPNSTGQGTLDDFQGQIDNLPPAQGIAKLLEEIRTPLERFNEDMLLLQGTRDFIKLREGASGTRSDPAFSTDRANRLQALELQGRRQLFADQDPVIANFADDVGMSLTASVGNGIRAGLRSGDTKTAVEAFTNSLQNALIDAFAAAVTEGLLGGTGAQDGIFDAFRQLFGSSEAAGTGTEAAP